MSISRKSKLPVQRVFAGLGLIASALAFSCFATHALAQPRVWNVPSNAEHIGPKSLRLDLTNQADPAILHRSEQWTATFRFSLSTGTNERIRDSYITPVDDLGWGVLPDGRILSLRSAGIRWSGVWLRSKTDDSKRVLNASTEIIVNSQKAHRYVKGLTVGPKGDIFVLTVTIPNEHRAEQLCEVYRLKEPTDGPSKEWQMTLVAGSGNRTLASEDNATPATEANLNAISLDPDRFSATMDGGFLFARSDEVIERATPTANGSFEIRQVVRLRRQIGCESTSYRALSFTEAFDGSIIIWGERIRAANTVGTPLILKVNRNESNIKVVAGEGDQSSLSELLPASSLKFASGPNGRLPLLPTPDGGILTVRPGGAPHLIYIGNDADDTMANEIENAFQEIKKQNANPAIELRKRFDDLREDEKLTLPLLPDPGEGSPVGVNLTELARAIRRENGQSFLALLPQELVNEVSYYRTRRRQSGWWRAFRAKLAVNVLAKKVSEQIRQYLGELEIHEPALAQNRYWGRHWEQETDRHLRRNEGELARQTAEKAQRFRDATASQCVHLQNTQEQLRLLRGLTEHQFGPLNENRQLPLQSVSVSTHSASRKRALGLGVGGR